jgi:hypothetical protein
VSRHRGLGRHRDDQVWGDADEVYGKLGKAVKLGLSPPEFDDDVLALDIAEFAKTLPELLQSRLRRDGRTAREKADPIDLPRRLRLDGERRGEEAERCTGDECPPVHHSITWSARCRSDGGIVRPRALAVFRLMTSSYLLGCSMGRSAGLAPLRILST